jgi:sterol desaturase/sphingolipid hydroxylase (fatty acid hydroxylase superfamily)
MSAAKIAAAFTPIIGTTIIARRARTTNTIRRTRAGIGLAALHAPLFPVAPFFVGAVWFSQANYYRVHKKSHQDPAWGRKHLPWHVDHHLGPDQNANWCVTWPWFDWVMGTRKKFVGTEAELKKPQRRGGEQADRGGEQQQVASEQAG